MASDHELRSTNKQVSPHTEQTNAFDCKIKLSHEKAHFGQVKTRSVTLFRNEEQTNYRIEFDQQDIST